MEPSILIRMRRLLQVSVDLRNQMSELQKLRDTIRKAEEIGRDQESAYPPSDIKALDEELRV